MKMSKLSHTYFLLLMIVVFLMWLILCKALQHVNILILQLLSVSDGKMLRPVVTRDDDTFW